MKNKITQNEIKRLVRQVLNEREREIDEEEMNNRTHFGIKEMRDDLTVKWLTNHPKWNWLVDPHNLYLDAVIGWDYDYECPIWYSGTWEEGIWGFGLWKDGTFEGEIWKDGRFFGGTFTGGTWEYGYFYDGTFAGGTWEDGGFFGGTFASGTWEGGTWIKGKIWDEELDDYVQSDLNPNEYFKNKK